MITPDTFCFFPICNTLFLAVKTICFLCRKQSVSLHVTECFPIGNKVFAQGKQFVTAARTIDAPSHFVVMGQEPPSFHPLLSSVP